VIIGEKFLFVCGGLEPGKDGIGDYVRRIASCLAKNGHSSLLLAFGDVYAHSDHSLSFLDDNELARVHRFRGSLSDETVFQAANNILYDFAPTLVSIQYNPYSFNPKGLPFRFLIALKRLLKSLPAHIVFHELWNSLYFSIPLRSKLYAPLQKQAIRLLRREFNIVSSFTTSEIYQSMLLRLGISSDVIPVFSNIPIINHADAAGSDTAKIFENLYSWNGPVFAIFGNQVGSLCRHTLENFLDSNGLMCDPIMLLAIGSQSPSSRILVEKISARLPKNSGLRYSGFLDEASISSILHNIDCALTTYPYELAGKSTAIAAIREHGKSVFFVGVNVDKNKGCRHLDGSRQAISFRLDMAVSHIENAASKSKVLCEL
jgi:hypothetical protein